MGEHVIGRTVQTSQKHTYMPGECRCFHCSAFDKRESCRPTDGILDWEIANNTCCGGFCMSQPTCAQPDRSECDIGRSSKGQDPLIKYGWYNRAPHLSCVYDVNKIDTRKQVLNYTDKFGVNNDVEMKYCTQKVKDCPKGMKECSRLKSIGEGGEECRKWYEAQPANVRDAAIQNYCLRNDTEDCKCVNRADSESYQLMKGAHSINDGCWFSACANRSGKYLVPSQLVNPSCPDKICQVLFDIMKTGNVSIDNVKNDIVCKYDKPVPVPPIPIPPRPVPPRPVPPVPPKDTYDAVIDYIVKNKVTIGAVLFVLILLCACRK